MSLQFSLILTSVLVCVFALNHLEELCVAHGLSKLLGNPLEVAQGNVPSLVVVKEVEDLLDVLARVLVAHFGGHHVEELEWQSKRVAKQG